MPKLKKLKSKRDRIVRLAREAVRLQDTEGLKHLLDSFCRATTLEEQLVAVETLARELPDGLVQTLNRSATGTLEQVYRDAEAEEIVAEQRAS